MKTTIVFLVGMTMSLAVAAQATFGLRTGYNLYTIYGKDDVGDRFYHRYEDGIHIGANVEIPLGSSAYLQPGLYFSEKGANFRNYEYMGKTFYGDVKLKYIELPVNLVFKPTVGKGKLLIGGGPYLAYGTGKEAGIKEGDIKIDYPVEFQKDVSTADLARTSFYYKPWDFGISGLLGYEFTNKFSVQLNGQAAFTRMNPTVNGREQGETVHRLIGFGGGFGYRF